MAKTNLSARNICVANVANQVAEPRMGFGPTATYPPTILSLPRNSMLPATDGSLGLGDASTAMASVEVWAVWGSAVSTSSVRSVRGLPHERRTNGAAFKRHQASKPIAAIAAAKV